MASIDFLLESSPDEDITLKSFIMINLQIQQAL